MKTSLMLLSLALSTLHAQEKIPYTEISQQFSTKRIKIVLPAVSIQDQEKKNEDTTKEQDFSKFEITDVQDIPTRGGSSMVITGEVNDSLSADIFYTSGETQFGIPPYLAVYISGQRYRPLTRKELQQIHGILKAYVKKSDVQWASVRAAIGFMEDRLNHPLEIQAEAPKTAKVGEVLSLKVKIQNVSDKEVYAVGALDGSDHHMRYPFYSIIVLRNGRSLKPDVNRCEEMNSLREENFLKLQPGDSFDPFDKKSMGHYMLSEFKFEKPGIHRIFVAYDTQWEDIKKWMGSRPLNDATQKELEALINKIPKEQMVAGPFWITVEE